MKPLSLISLLAVSSAAFLGGSLLVENAEAQSSYKPAAKAVAPLAVAELFKSYHRDNWLVAAKRS